MLIKPPSEDRTAPICVRRRARSPGVNTAGCSPCWRRLGIVNKSPLVAPLSSGSSCTPSSLEKALACGLDELATGETTPSNAPVDALKSLSFELCRWHRSEARGRKISSADLRQHASASVGTAPRSIQPPSVDSCGEKRSSSAAWAPGCSRSRRRVFGSREVLRRLFNSPARASRA